LFFQKKSAPATPFAEQSLGWDTERRYQSLRVQISHWNVVVRPMLIGEQGGEVELCFEGFAKIGSRASIRVLGDIEIRKDPDPPQMLQDHWTRVPEKVEGYFSLSKSGEEEPRLDMTLYCTREILEWAFKGFLVGASSPHGTTSLDIDVGYPDQMSADFWKTGWRSETLQVLSWKIISGSGDSTIDLKR
jgi:hypothetical protein